MPPYGGQPLGPSSDNRRIEQRQIPWMHSEGTRGRESKKSPGPTAPRDRTVLGTLRRPLSTATVCRCPRLSRGPYLHPINNSTGATACMASADIWTIPSTTERRLLATSRLTEAGPARPWPRRHSTAEAGRRCTESACRRSTQTAPVSSRRDSNGSQRHTSTRPARPNGPRTHSRRRPPTTIPYGRPAPTSPTGAA